MSNQTNKPKSLVFTEQQISFNCIGNKPAVGTTIAVKIATNTDGSIKLFDHTAKSGIVTPSCMIRCSANLSDGSALLCSNDPKYIDEHAEILLDDNGTPFFYVTTANPVFEPVGNTTTTSLSALMGGN